MILLDIILLIIFVGAPVSICIAWWVWARVRSAEAPKWRAQILLGGLMAGSANVVMFCSWFICRLCAGPTPEVWKLKDICGDAGMYLSLLALGGAIFGYGKARVPLVACSILGFLTWINIGIL